jgi:NDP-sugar pyrophosphorylase family protein
VKPTLLVLAAGMGSRYGGLKQVDPVGPSGEILLEYSVHDAIRAGFGRIVFVIRKDIEATFREHITSRIEGKLPYHFAYQELDALPADYALPDGRTKPWGTAHAILCAQSLISEPFVAINADDFYGPESFAVVSKYLEAGGNNLASQDHCMVGFQLRKTLSEFGSVSRGLCEVDQAHRLLSVTEHTKIEPSGSGAVSHLEGSAGTTQQLTGDEYVSMNFWGLYPSIFGELSSQFSQFLSQRGTELKSEFYIPTVLDNLISGKRGSVTVLPSSESWFGVTYPDDKPRVVEQIRQKIAQGIYGENLWG